LKSCLMHFVGIKQDGFKRSQSAAAPLSFAAVLLHRVSLPC